MTNNSGAGPWCAVALGSLPAGAPPGTPLAWATQSVTGSGYQLFQFAGLLAPGRTLKKVQLQCPAHHALGLDWMQIQDSLSEFGPLSEATVTWKDTRNPVADATVAVARAMLDGTVWLGTDQDGLGVMEGGVWHTQNGTGTRSLMMGGTVGVADILPFDDGSHEVIVLTGDESGAGPLGGLWHSPDGGDHWDQVGSSVAQWPPMVAGASDPTDDVAGYTLETNCYGAHFGRAWQTGGGHHLVADSIPAQAGDVVYIANGDWDNLGVSVYDGTRVCPLKNVGDPLPADRVGALLRVDAQPYGTPVLVVGYRPRPNGGAGLYACALPPGGVDCSGGSAADCTEVTVDPWHTSPQWDLSGIDVRDLQEDTWASDDGGVTDWTGVLVADSGAGSVMENDTHNGKNPFPARSAPGLGWDTVWLTPGQEMAMGQYALVPSAVNMWLVWGLDREWLDHDIGSDGSMNPGPEGDVKFTYWPTIDPDGNTFQGVPVADVTVGRDGHIWSAVGDEGLVQFDGSLPFTGLGSESDCLWGGWHSGSNSVWVADRLPEANGGEGPPPIPGPFDPGDLFPFQQRDRHRGRFRGRNRELPHRGHARPGHLARRAHVVILLLACTGTLVATPQPDTAVPDTGDTGVPDTGDTSGETGEDTGPSTRDADHDGYSPAEGDCDDERAHVYPGAADYCDGLDADCDGEPIPAGSCSLEWDPTAMWTWEIVPYSDTHPEVLVAGDVGGGPEPELVMNGWVDEPYQEIVTELTGPTSGWPAKQYWGDPFTGEGDSSLVILAPVPIIDSTADGRGDLWVLTETGASVGGAFLSGQLVGDLDGDGLAEMTFGVSGVDAAFVDILPGRDWRDDAHLQDIVTQLSNSTGRLLRAYGEPTPPGDMDGDGLDDGFFTADCSDRGYCSAFTTGGVPSGDVGEWAYAWVCDHAGATEWMDDIDGDGARDPRVSNVVVPSGILRDGGIFQLPEVQGVRFDPYQNPESSADLDGDGYPEWIFNDQDYSPNVRTLIVKGFPIPWEDASKW